MVGLNGLVGDDCCIDIEVVHTLSGELKMEILTYTYGAYFLFCCESLVVGSVIVQLISLSSPPITLPTSTSQIAHRTLTLTSPD